MAHDLSNHDLPGHCQIRLSSALMVDALDSNLRASPARAEDSPLQQKAELKCALNQ